MITDNLPKIIYGHDDDDDINTLIPNKYNQDIIMCRYKIYDKEGNRMFIQIPEPDVF